MKFKTIPCQFCKTGHAHITYEENRVYQLNCPDCGSVILRKDVSWDAAVEFFERMVISAGWIPVTERLPQEDLPLGALCEVVQVLLQNGKVSVGWCNRGLKCWYYLPINDTRFVGHGYELTPVVAWKPLSEPPKEV